MTSTIRCLKQKYRFVRDPIYRLFRLKEINFLKTFIDEDMSIFSMNCFGGRIYQDLHRKYTSPTVGLFFSASDFNKILKDITIIKNELTFITPPQQPIASCSYPIAVIKGTDIKIHFLHYKNEKEAKEKWERRVSRFNFENFIAIGVYQNGCTEDILREFSAIPISKKFFFSTKKMDIPGVLYTPEYDGLESHPDIVKYANVFYRHLVRYIKQQNGHK